MTIKAAKASKGGKKSKAKTSGAKRARKSLEKVAAEFANPDRSADLAHLDAVRAVAHDAAELWDRYAELKERAKDIKKEAQGLDARVRSMLRDGPAWPVLFNKHDAETPSAEQNPKTPAGSEATSTGSSSDAWRATPLATLADLAGGSGSRTKALKALEKHGVETLGQLEDLRGKFPGGEWFSAVKGLGREGAGEVENAALDWLSKNRDAAVLEAARGAAPAPEADDVGRQIARFLQSLYEFGSVPTLAEVKSRLVGTMQSGPEWQGLGGYSLAGEKVGLQVIEWNGKASQGEQIVPYGWIVRELHELAAEARNKAAATGGDPFADLGKVLKHAGKDDQESFRDEVDGDLARAGLLVGKIQTQARDLRTGGGKGKRRK